MDAGIGMRRKASCEGERQLLPRKTRQQIARARVQTTAGNFAERTLGLWHAACPWWGQVPQAPWPVYQRLRPGPGCGASTLALRAHRRIIATSFADRAHGGQM